MQWLEAGIVFETEDLFAQTAAELVCNIFYDLGLSGVVTEDPVPVSDHGVRGRVIGYLPVDEALEQTRADLEQMASGLSARHPVRCTLEFTPCDDQDWANAWKDHFFVQKIGRNIVVRPTWRDHVPEPGEVVIDLDPGMAFGTGTHPTTAMCLEMVEKHLAPGTAFLDVGTGSGILMIAAQKLGAKTVWGVDNDGVAVKIAAENLERNGIFAGGNACRIMRADLVTGVDRAFDLVTANILSEVIVALADDVGRVVVPGGLLVCSGIIEPKQAMVEAKLTACGFDIIERKTTDLWVCLVARRTP
ncbi:50S ribosomal protein L11 methyltransferase [Desulfosudis oleivorans]|uniref:Ribosomal protein L11 methyltransferase n=1 Tax=Desulfosudis oleivorans (strain DSM 6200 / JCM 39069 / Hxd3) TaxID=96561 RepID=PRMA_DESOH|nr:50S ribosomal protein L11 methyltransferase [Desulfosudis oleivorans]A8ZW25.1 RecName: Full=Ribosomal protein L11 methyltransferase; Short=L11 Mtase [Desulfosudis oleivorans Hxd3]ABW68259.1 ribosomal protein L11 methyltransferase [Desulfosudis oleivorans Hxd3]